MLKASLRQSPDEGDLSQLPSMERSSTFMPPLSKDPYRKISAYSGVPLHIPLQATGTLRGLWLSVFHRPKSVKAHEVSAFRSLVPVLESFLWCFVLKDGDGSRNGVSRRTCFVSNLPAMHVKASSNPFSSCMLLVTRCMVSLEAGEPAVLPICLGSPW